MAENNDQRNIDSSPPKRTIATSIELPLFLLLAAIAITESSVNNVILYRSCLYALNHTVDECKIFLSPIKTNATTDLEDEVQKYSTYILTVKIVLENVCPAILSLFVGVWSDTYGRKPLLVMPMFGMSITGILLVIFVSLESLNPWCFLLTSIPFSLTGGYVILFTGANCYVNDTSSSSSKSIRMFILAAAISLGSFFGSFFTSFLVEKMGYVYVLLFTATINILTFGFTKIWIIESLTIAIQGGVKSLFHFSHIKGMLKECFKQRPNNERKQIILLAVIKLFLVIVTLGCSSLEYLYTREKLHWSLKDYTRYSAISTLIIFLGSYLGVVIFQKYFRIGDVTLLLIATLTACFDCTIKAFVVYSWHMYISTFVAPFKGLPLPLINSYVTKFLPEEDIAKVFALLCAVESLAPIIGPVIYNSLYSFTLSVFPGAIYVLSAAINFICVLMLLPVAYYSWNRSQTYTRWN